MVTKILLVDDNVDLADALLEQIALHDEFEITLSASATEAYEALKAQDFGLILLDIGLPDQDGRETCKKMRDLNVTVPIIMLTGAASEADLILGLDAGANDYITKPFRFGELLARMRAHLRQHEKSETAALNIGPYIFQPAVKLLTREDDGARIRLTEKETNILKYLLRAGPKTVHRDVLLEEVWGYNASVTTHTLETHIYRLRLKIEADPSNAEILVTDAGGYRLNA